MGMFFRKEFNSLHDLFLDQVEDLYDAEQRIVKALPKMIEAAHSHELKTVLEMHLRETEGQITRLEEVFRSIDHTPQREACEAIKGLIREGEELMSAKGDPATKDAAIIAAAQRVEHYEMAGYGTARTFAQQLGHTRAAQLLEATLEEEKRADLKLTGIAEAAVNTQAASH